MINKLKEKARRWQRNMYPEFSEMVVSQKGDDFCFTFSIPGECVNPIGLIINSKTGDMWEINCPSPEWFEFSD